MSPNLRVVLADDHPVYRRGLRTMLESFGDFVVVGEAGDGATAVELARQTAPDVVVLDINMPDVDGIEATRQITSLVPPPGVLMLTMFEDDASLFAAMRAGARGYVVKAAGEDEIVHAIRAIAAGGAVFGAAVARRMSGYFATYRPTGAGSPFPELTAREAEILGLVADGHGNAVIARRLFITTKTVGNHVSNIFTKLQVADRAAAIVRARRAGLGETSDDEKGLNQ